ncbi:MAG: glycoside hydrolase family 3 N-terminal domain-containing protein [Chloroflexota bacterium]
MSRIALSTILLSVLIAAPHHAARAQGTPEPGTPAAVQDLFDIMTPEERVGQLFLVSFAGTETSNTSRIYDLVVNQHVGGVALLAANDNFVAAPDTLAGARGLTRGLQQVEWNSSVRPPSDPVTGQSLARAFVPLFIATIQDGDGAPGDQLFTGLTPLPSAMAIGAAWSPDLAQQVGAITGGELASLGINMYFGPSLDVLENPSALSGNDLGAGVFGGDPFWVSIMGSAFVRGLHEGSQDRLLVIPKFFPGRGSSDRLSEREVATVRKSLEELKQIELPPFFSVTRETADAATSADGLLLSHIRYQGLQGNIRATTKPVSFDAQALASILSLPEFASWREAGGLIVSDNLGSNAVRHFYSSGTGFSARTVARDAFVAGNDLLYMGNIVASDATDNYATVRDVIGFFARKYREDPGFAQRVDASVLRILTVKYGLHDRFDLASVLAQRADAAAPGTAKQLTLEVASRAATLLSPAPQDLSTLVQAPPQLRDQIVFFSDITPAKQCSTCVEVPSLAVDALQRAIVGLYGPEAGNQTTSFRLASYSLDAAGSYAAGESPPYLAEDLASAAWVVFSLVDNNNGQARLISNFLAAEQDLLREKRVILFAFGAPTYLDATDVSRLSAYYALYSKQPAFVEVAARLLFQEITPVGASPVSVPGLGYDLRSITAPAPDQIITLALDLPPSTAPAGGPTPEATPVPLFKIGDTIGIRTGTIKDHNGHQVPDGTVVTFSMELRGEGGIILQQQETTTTQGIARVSFGLEKPGLLEIHATSDPAQVSQVLQLDVSSGGQPAAVTVIVPQLTPAIDAPFGQTPIPEEDDFVTLAGTLRFSAWVATVLLLIAGALVIGFAGWRLAGEHWGVRWGLGALAGGLLPYNYLALGLPGGPDFAAEAGIGGIVLVSAAGLLAGWIAGWLWWRRSGE